MINIITHCPGTLASGHEKYSITCLRRVFGGKNVHHILPYNSPQAGDGIDDAFIENRTRMSISGVQEKFSIVLDKNKLRLIEQGERGDYILKPIPRAGKHAEYMPANEHLTMQIARQVYGVETAENAMIFFENGEAAYITKRFDMDDLGKLKMESFTTLAGYTPQTHGEDYKYLGSYLDLFVLLQNNIATYRIEAIKLFRLIVFNYVFSNGDAHLKNFSLLETPQGDYRLSPAYDLLNSKIHINDAAFALKDGLLPPHKTTGNVWSQFNALANEAGLTQKQTHRIFNNLRGNNHKVEQLITNSFLSDQLKRNYLQNYQRRIKKLQEK